MISKWEHVICISKRNTQQSNRNGPVKHISAPFRYSDNILFALSSIFGHKGVQSGCTGMSWTSCQRVMYCIVVFGTMRRRPHRFRSNSWTTRQDNRSWTSSSSTPNLPSEGFLCISLSRMDSISVFCKVSRIGQVIVNLKFLQTEAENSVLANRLILGSKGCLDHSNQPDGCLESI